MFTNMDTNFLFGISLTASFFAGVLAMMAPCCITFLFPSYLGTIFKEGKKVMFYTLIFAIGLASILVPIALGVRTAIFFLDAYHKQVYYLGGLIMIAMGLMTLKPFFHIPRFFHVENFEDKKINIPNVFILGLMSGLTSACCAPVLFAAVTLTSLSTNLLQAILVSSAYILGIVMPLFVMSMFYEKLTGRIDMAKKNKIYNTLKYIGAGIFFVTGILILIFNYLGKIQMGQMEQYGKTIRLAVFEISKYFQNPILDILTFAIIIFIFYKLIRYKGNEKI